MANLKKANRQNRSQPTPRYFTAMTLWQMNEVDAARMQLAEAEELFAEGPDRDQWAWAARREANALISD